jgi:hypothetical protein
LQPWEGLQKTLSDKLDNVYFFTLMIVSAKVESQADPVISRCIPTLARLTFANGAIKTI